MSRLGKGGEKGRRREREGRGKKSKKELREKRGRVIIHYTRPNMFFIKGSGLNFDLDGNEVLGTKILGDVIK